MCMCKETSLYTVVRGADCRVLSMSFNSFAFLRPIHSTHVNCTSATTPPRDCERALCQEVNSAKQENQLRSRNKSTTSKRHSATGQRGDPTRDKSKTTQGTVKRLVSSPHKCLTAQQQTKAPNKTCHGAQTRSSFELSTAKHSLRNSAVH